MYESYIDRNFHQIFSCDAAQIGSDSNEYTLTISGHRKALSRNKRLTMCKFLCSS